MQIAENLYANTDKFIKGNTTRFVYSGKLFNKDTVEHEAVYFCYSQVKPKKNQTNNITKVQMIKSDLGFQTDLLLDQLGNMYFYFETDDKKDNNRGHSYKIEVEEMPLALLVLKQQTLPQKISRFDYFKDHIKETISRAFDTFSKIRNLNSYSKEKIVIEDILIK